GLTRASSPQKLSDEFMIFAETKTRRPPGCGKSRSVESEENQKQVFLPSHRPWKSRTTRAIPIFPTAPTAAGFSTSLTTKVGVGPNETIKRGQIKLTKPAWPASFRLSSATPRLRRADA